MRLSLLENSDMDRSRLFVRVRADGLRDALAEPRRTVCAFGGRSVPKEEPVVHVAGHIAAVPNLLVPFVLHVLIVLIGISPASARQFEVPGLRDRLEGLVYRTPALSFRLRSDEWLGGEHAWSSGVVIRLAADTLRMDVELGRGDGGTVILLGSRVKAWRRGILSFIRLTYDRTHPRVLSLRGHDLGAIGFFDEATWILAHPGEARVRTGPGADAFEFTDRLGDDHVVVWPSDLLHPDMDTVRSGDDVVERYAYSDIRPASGEELRSVRW